MANRIGLSTKHTRTHTYTGSSSSGSSRINSGDNEQKNFSLEITWFARAHLQYTIFSSHTLFCSLKYPFTRTSREIGPYSLIYCWDTREAISWIEYTFFFARYFSESCFHLFSRRTHQINATRMKMKWKWKKKKTWIFTFLVSDRKKNRNDCNMSILLFKSVRSVCLLPLLDSIFFVARLALFFSSFFFCSFILFVSCLPSIRMQQ